MKVKVTVWTLASDNDNGTQAQVFLTEREALRDYAFRVLDEPTPEEQSAVEEKAERLISKHCEDLSWLEVANQTEGEENEDIYDFLRSQHGPLDTYSIDSHELEIEIPEVVTTEKVRKALVELLDEVESLPRLRKKGEIYQSGEYTLEASGTLTELDRIVSGPDGTPEAHEAQEGGKEGQETIP